jgi:hypothetical protein
MGVLGMIKMFELLKILRESLFQLIKFNNKVTAISQLKLAIGQIEELIYELQNPTPLTPQQFFEQERRELDGKAAVYGLYTTNYSPVPSTYWTTFSYEDAKASPRVSAIVCAYNLTEPPDAAWRPK